jgi:hypothetical protein
MATKKKAAGPKVPSASKLKDLQTRLNKDKALRAKFVKDPGGVLSAEGVDIGTAKANQIAKYLADMTAPQRAAFQAELVRVTIGISVTVRIRINIGITL